jgi:hypothetical protein
MSDSFAGYSDGRYKDDDPESDKSADESTITHTPPAMTGSDKPDDDPLVSFSWL